MINSRVFRQESSSTHCAGTRESMDVEPHRHNERWPYQHTQEHVCGVSQTQWKVTYQHTESTGVEPYFKSQHCNALTFGQVTDLHWVQFSSMQNENNVQISELWEWKELTPWSAQNEWHTESEWPKLKCQLCCMRLGNLGSYLTFRISIFLARKRSKGSILTLITVHLANIHNYLTPESKQTSLLRK